MSTRRVRDIGCRLFLGLGRIGYGVCRIGLRPTFGCTFGLITFRGRGGLLLRDKQLGSSNEEHGPEQTGTEQESTHSHL
jgi:hypothetical protein